MASTQHNASASFTHQESWLNLLIGESARFDETGVKSALIAVAGPDLDERQSRQVASLLEHSKARTDRHHRVSPTRHAVLVAPVDDLFDVARRAQQLQDSALRHGFPVRVSFAARRVDEALLDTWARAEAELDRALLRDDAGSDE